MVSKSKLLSSSYSSSYDSPTHYESEEVVMLIKWSYILPPYLTPSGSSLPLIFCIHVRWGPISWGGYLPCRKDYKVMVFYM
jgi:hypothetical protein